MEKAKNMFLACYIPLSKIFIQQWVEQVIIWFYSVIGPAEFNNVSMEMVV